jgi:hypothetical protein
MSERSAFNTAGYVAYTTLDSANVSTGNAPIGVPTDASTAYSYEARLYLKVSKAPANNVTNIRYWRTPANPATGVFLYVGTAVASATPVITKSTKATRNSTAYSSYDTSLLWSNKALTAINHISFTLIMQARIDSAAAIQELTNEEMLSHYSYDES